MLTAKKIICSLDSKVSLIDDLYELVYEEQCSKTIF